MNYTQQLERFKDALVSVLINERLDQFKAERLEDETLIEEVLTILDEEGIDIDSLTEEQLDDLLDEMGIHL